MMSFRSIALGGAALSLALGVAVWSPPAPAQTEGEAPPAVVAAQAQLDEARRAAEEAVAAGQDPAGAQAALAIAEANLAVEQARAALAAAQAAGGDVATAEAAVIEAEARLETARAASVMPAEPAPAEQPAAEQPVAEEPAAEEPPAEQPPAEEQPAAEQAPAEEQPAAEQPSAEEQPAAEEPAAEQPVAEEPPADEQPAAEPAPEQPAEQPQPEQPAEQPAADAADQPEEPPVEEPPAEEQPAETTAEEPAETTTEQPAETADEQPVEPTAAEQPVAGDQPAAEEQPAEDAEAEAAPELTPEELQAAQQESAEAAVEEAEAREAAKSEEEREEDEDERLEILGAAAAGAAIGALVPLLGGRIVDQQDDRIIIQQGDQFIVRKDETVRLLTDGSTIEMEVLEAGYTRETVTRPDGVQIVTLRDPAGYPVRRIRRLPTGEEFVLFDEVPEAVAAEGEPLPLLPPLPELQPTSIEAGNASLAQIETALTAPPVMEELPRAFTLREVRQVAQLRWLVPSIDLDTLTFATNSAELSADQAAALDNLGRTLADIVWAKPDEVFLVEGHTDAVGADLYNLTLSDRRAETVATLLTELYGVPPENLVTQGYGEQYLKIPTLGAERQNRRVEVRRITPLLR